VVVLAVGGLLVRNGITALQNANLAPKQTIESIQEDAQWAKNQTS
jgi:hypothetical protein